MQEHECVCDYSNLRSLIKVLLSIGQLGQQIKLVILQNIGPLVWKINKTIY